MPRSVMRCSLVALVAALAPTLAGDRVAPAGPLQAAAARLNLTSGPSLDDTVTALRAAGPAGLAAALAERDRLSRAGDDTADVDAALDRLAGQRGAAQSRLFWYTDLDAALAAAAAADKPVLSLRLLGRLDESLSCANSRLFRALLYPDPEVGRVLRERYVLHWEAVRPAPVIRIDFGDGRVIERTITGNSIHYVLASDGRILDAIPGLNQPSTFVSNLFQAASRLHLDRESLQASWREEIKHLARTHLDAAAVSGLSRDVVQSWQPVAFDADGTVPARAAAPLALTKRAIERPLLGGLDPLAASADPAVTPWTRLGEYYRHPQALSEAAIAQVAAQSGLQGEALTTMLSTLESTMLADTAQNQLSLRRNLLIWLADGEGDLGLAEFNEHVYRALFKTPSDDPWLGLAPADVFAAIDGGGTIVGNG